MTLSARTPRQLSVLIVLAACLTTQVLLPAQSRAQPSDGVRVTQLKPRFYLVGNGSGNLVVYVDDTLSLVAGCQAPALVSAARSLLRSLHAPAVRYALMLESDSAAVFGDGGWASSGAITIAQENLWYRITKRVDSLTRAGAGAGGRPPLLSFSDIVQLYLPHEEPHFAHRPRGVTNADVVIHFEGGGFAMLGNLIGADEYPDVSRAHRSRLDELVNSIDWFADSLPRRKVEPLIPGRGRALTVDDLHDYSRMLTTVIGRVTELRAAGNSEEAVVAAKPTAEFDSRWGHGRISGDLFVRNLFELLSAR